MPPPPDLAILLVQIQFPGMERRESDVFKLWLQAHGDAYDRLEFNVRLGEGGRPLDTFDETTRRQQTLVTQKRADAIAWLQDQADILEVKLRAGLNAVGQLVGYRELFMRDRPELPPPRLRIIALWADPDVEFVAGAQGVELVLFERPRSSPGAPS